MGVGEMCVYQGTYALLEHTADETSGFFRTILEGCGGRVAVEATHGDAKEGSAGEELVVGLTEAGSLEAHDKSAMRRFEGGRDISVPAQAR